MKVILLQDVAKLGKRFEVVDVPNGRALNMLIPQGAAEEATPANIKRVEARKAKQSADQSAVSETFLAAVEALKSQTLTVTVEANEQGHLFEALKADKVVAAATAAGATLNESQIHMTEPIKEVGDHTVTLREGEHEHALAITVTAA